MTHSLHTVEESPPPQKNTVNKRYSNLAVITRQCSCVSLSAKPQLEISQPFLFCILPRLHGAPLKSLLIRALGDREAALATGDRPVLCLTDQGHALSED